MQSCLTCLPSALMVSLSAAAWGVAMMVFRTPLVQMRSSLRSKMFRVWQYRSRKGCRLPGFNAYTTCGAEGAPWWGLWWTGLVWGHHLIEPLHREQWMGWGRPNADKQLRRASQCVR